MEINTFFLRVSARCNLECDYCYVFKHRDLSWKNYPSIISDENINIFCKRIKEYVFGKSLEDIYIVFHGGEPLICGEEKIINFVETINSSMKDIVRMHYSVQTNGTLLTEEFVEECDRRNIGISISIDGCKDLHDKHRKYKSGIGSYEDVMKAIKILKKYPQIFEGVIGVIDPLFSPDMVLSFFDSNGIENIDLLLPDSTYQDLPIGRDKNPDLYKKWLIEAFDAWFFKYQNIHFRTFELLLNGILGEQTSLDAFGLGTLDYLTIETDGSYHTSDILKITYENASFLDLYLENNTIDEAFVFVNQKV